MKRFLGLMMLAGLAAPCLGQAADLSKSDLKYMSESAQGLMSELKLGTMAEQRASDQGVKDFGKQMVADHGKDLQELQQLAKQKQVKLPETMSDEQTKEASKLEKLSGKDFDREYVKYELKDHKDDIKEQKEVMKKTRDPELKQFASKELETVTGHKKTVDALHARIK
jgi:putative membrane protein